MLVVTVARGPGEAELPGVVDEARRLAERFPGRTAVLADGAATFAGVAAALPECGWAHFACHAAADLSDPSAGHLVLADHRTRPLTVLDLARLRLDGAELAYLSACSTARTGPRLADEAIHLASAFQLAGYRYVIATLWPVVDRPAVHIATGVYEVLAADGAPAAAYALHRTIRAQRDRTPDRPSAWAAHLHSGG